MSVKWHHEQHRFVQGPLQCCRAGGTVSCRLCLTNTWRPAPCRTGSTSCSPDSCGPCWSPSTGQKVQKFKKKHSLNSFATTLDINQYKFWEFGMRVPKKLRCDHIVTAGRWAAPAITTSRGRAAAGWTNTSPSSSSGLTSSTHWRLAASLRLGW